MEVAECFRERSEMARQLDKLMEVVRGQDGTEAMDGMVVSVEMCRRDAI